VIVVAHLDQRELDERTLRHVHRAIAAIVQKLAQGRFAIGFDRQVDPLEGDRDRAIALFEEASAGYQQADMAAFVRALTSLESFMARVELPAGESLKSPPTGARLVSLAAGDQSVEAELLGPAPVVDSQTQGQSFLFLVRENSLSLAPGAALTGYLELPGQPLNGVIVPRVAVLRHNGQAWVYVQTAADKFTRREIHLHHSVEAGWLVTTGLSATDRIVTIGAQTLLSEELNSSGPSSSAKD